LTHIKGVPSRMQQGNPDFFPALPEKHDRGPVWQPRGLEEFGPYAS
jgi:hypothetical protein